MVWRGDEMTWEIVLGIIALVGAFVTVMGVVVKVNGTLTRLEEAVRQLREFIEKQEQKNTKYAEQLADHELRITRLEDRD